MKVWFQNHLVNNIYLNLGEGMVPEPADEMATPGEQTETGTKSVRYLIIYWQKKHEKLDNFTNIFIKKDSGFYF